MIVRLPKNYRHPMGYDFGGYWGYYESGELILAERCMSDLIDTLRHAGLYVQKAVA